MRCSPSSAIARASRLVRLVTPVLSAAVIAACSTGSPAQPSGTPSIVAPAPASPAGGAVVPFSSLPARLAVTNAVVTNGKTPTYTFELAYDAGFSAKAVTKSGITEGTNGQTTVAVDSLVAGTTYFWHAKVDAGGTSSAFGQTASFTIGGQVLLSNPAPLGPANGSLVPPQPTLAVTNAVKTGPAGAVTYKFEVSDTQAFQTLVASGTQAESFNQTTFTPAAALPIGKTFYWRATAFDATNGVSSSPSAVASFTTTAPTIQGQLAAAQGLVLWPGAQPSGSTGHATLGDNWDIQGVVSFTGVTFTSPGLEELRIFDLLDHGYTPQQAIDFLHANGYPTIAVAYVVGNGIPVIGFEFDYMAATYGPWDLIIRIGA